MSADGRSDEPKLGADEVERIARLARIRVVPSELEAIARDLRGILRDFERIRAAEAATPPDRRGSAPAPRGPIERTREDRPGSDPLARSVRQLAPAGREGFITVPGLPELEHGGGAGRAGAQTEHP